MGVTLLWGMFTVKMTFQKSNFEMPDGKYLAKFLGTTERDATGATDQKTGKPLPPPMTWDFQIEDAGEHHGKKADRMTGRVPTPKSACGKFLAAITDTVLKDGQEVDLAPFVGRIYRITVEDNRVSDNPAPVLMAAAGAPAAAPPRPAPARPGQPAKGPPQAEYWIDHDSLRDKAIPHGGVDAKLESLKLVGETLLCKDGTEQWLPASEFGFKGYIPF